MRMLLCFLNHPNHTCEQTCCWCRYCILIGRKARDTRSKECSKMKIEYRIEGGVFKGEGGVDCLDALFHLCLTLVSVLSL